MKPIILREGEHSMKDLEKLKSEVSIWKEIEVFDLQLKELFEITHPELLKSPGVDDIRDKFISERTSAQDGQFRGNWIYFPWSGRLVHAVNQADYDRLRTNRNRNLITGEEQRKLLDTCVGIVGLSVGSNVASSLLYGGIADHLKLAEFDTLETTNLNRIRARLDQIGAQKIDFVTEGLYETNPYMDIHCLPERLDRENLRAFMMGDPKPRVVFEIIDSFEMKIHLRTLARENGIPVVMVTNLGDRILMDVERYDLDKDTEYFNGRAGDVPHDMLERPDVTDELKHKYAVELAGVEHIPQRALDSVAEIGKTLVGRPQLASSVVIAGGLGAYIVRKIVLGQDMPSCSWLVDLDGIFSEQNAL